jgi:hypothetical protein
VSSGIRDSKLPPAWSASTTTSNLYDDDRMPNMLRVTWSGIALHGGPVSGHPASSPGARDPASEPSSNPLISRR